MSISTLVLTAIIGAAASQPVTLVENGGSCSSIVIPDGATPTIHHAASEFATYLKRISGAGVPIVDEKEADCSTRIDIGLTSRTRESLPEEFLNDEERVLLHADPKGVMICGSRDRATLFAVYRYFCQSTLSDWALDGPPYYTIGKLLWDPSANPEAIAHEWIDGMFGPAAGPMSDFYAAVDAAVHTNGKPYSDNPLRDVPGLYDSDLLARASSALDRAEQMISRNRSFWRWMSGVSRLFAASSSTPKKANGIESNPRRRSPESPAGKRWSSVFRPIFLTRNERGRRSGLAAPTARSGLPISGINNRKW